MENLENIKKNNAELYEKLQKYNCKMTYNNKVIYEGLYNENIDYKKYKQENIVCEFNINNNNIILLLKENENIEKLNKLFENKEFNNIYDDAKLFNKAMNLANNLPLYNFDKEMFENKIQNDIKKYGMNFQKIYENLNVNEKLKINSKSQITDSEISEKSKEDRYLSNWQLFNELITNVTLEEKQLRDMFANLKDDELKVWIEEVKNCYVGTNQEDEANKIGNDIDLARFYHKYPIED